MTACCSLAGRGLGADGLLQLGGDVVERLGHDGVEHRVGPGDAGARAHGAELELVAGEGERRGPVAVAGVARQLRQRARRRGRACRPGWCAWAAPSRPARGCR